MGAAGRRESPGSFQHRAKEQTAMQNQEHDEVTRLREQVAALEGRVDAMSLVLHGSIIMADDAIRRHIEGIIAMLEPMIGTLRNPAQTRFLREWLSTLQRSGESPKPSLSDFRAAEDR